MSTHPHVTFWGFPGGSDSKESTGDPGSIPGSARSPEEGNDNLFQYSYLGNSMDTGAWQATVHGVTKSQTRLTFTTMLPGGLMVRIHAFTAGPLV